MPPETTTNAAVPLERAERNPLMTDDGYQLLNRISQHPDAPRWNYVVGDRLQAQDLERVQRFRHDLNQAPRDHGSAPPEWLFEWIRQQRESTTIFAEHLPDGFELQRDWTHVPTTAREDLAVKPEDLVPIDADLERMIVYDTSGTTGHALVVPSHPAAIASNHPLAEYALARHGVRPDFGPDMVACVNVCAQVHTVVFPNVFAAWNQAGFAKVNLNQNDWNSVESARRFFQTMDPAFLTGDPVGFAEMFKWEIELRPKAMISTALTLSHGLKDTLEARYRCPVIDWFSLTETGPIAYSCTHGAMHLLPHDLYVETIDDDGFPTEPGAPGEITVSGGRNPYLPLLRYRTGDHASINHDPCPCGDKPPTLANLSGRRPVCFRGANDRVVNPVDVGRILRHQAFVSHQFIQRQDRSCELIIRPAPGDPPNLDAIKHALTELFGPSIPINARLDETLGHDAPGAKVFPYVSELDLELDRP